MPLFARPNILEAISTGFSVSKTIDQIQTEGIRKGKRAGKGTRGTIAGGVMRICGECGCGFESIFRAGEP